jgi:CRP/FNR family transcriptional regulator, nitrogen oxide reductase regulator
MGKLPDDIICFFCNSPFFKGIPQKIVGSLLDKGEGAAFEKGSTIAGIGDNVDTVFFVFSGLIRVSACSSSGRRVTFLLVKKGEPYNLLGPFLNRPRFLEAQAAENVRCIRIRGRDYLNFLADHPVIVPNIFRWIGVALDSANSRILDLMEKKVDTRILRVLSTLYQKFGSPLQFTSPEIAEIAGTTPESTLRIMGQLRDMGIITTGRGKIWIKDAQALHDIEFGIITI